MFLAIDNVYLFPQCHIFWFSFVLWESNSHNTYWHLIYVLYFLLLWWNTMTKSNLGGKLFISASWFHITVHHRGKSEQEPKGRNWGRNFRRNKLLIALLSMAYSAYFLIYQVSIGRSFLRQALIDKIHYKFVHRPVWWRNFLSGGFVFPNDFSSCQDNIKLACT